jgi:hypothetical protein
MFILWLRTEVLSFAVPMSSDVETALPSPDWPSGPVGVTNRHKHKVDRRPPPAGQAMHARIQGPDAVGEANGFIGLWRYGHLE